MRTGRSRRTAGSSRALDARIPPPVVALLTAGGMWLLARGWPLARADVPGLVPAGWAVACMGVVVSVAGIWAFRRAGTTVDPHHPERASRMVTTGIYRFTRNPMYLGLLLVLLGCWIALGAASATVGPPLFAWYIRRFQIAPEERALHDLFGAEYAGYRAHTRRWL